MDVFSCQEDIFAQKSFMTKSPYVECSFSDLTYKRLFGISVCFLILFGLGIPILFSILLRARQKKIKESDLITREWLGFLYENYK